MALNDKMNYSEKLRDPRWQKKRLEIMDRDLWSCQHCFDESSILHVHHKIYEPDKMPWEYHNDLLITLCEACHAAEEKNKQAFWDLRIEIAKKFSNYNMLELANAFKKIPIHAVTNPTVLVDVILFALKSEKMMNLLDKYYFESIRPKK